METGRKGLGEDHVNIDAVWLALNMKRNNKWLPRLGNWKR